MEKRFKRSLIASVVLHSLLFVGLGVSGGGSGEGNGEEGDKEGKGSGHNVGQILEKKQLEEKVEVTLIEQAPEIVVKKKEENQAEKIKEEIKGDAGYYGIGVYIDIFGEDVEISSGLWSKDRYRGITITKVIAGNPADKAGLQDGDVMYKIDGQPFNGGRDVIGDQPGWITLSIKRGNQFFDVRVYRDWINTRKDGNGRNSPISP